MRLPSLPWGRGEAQTKHPHPRASGLERPRRTLVAWRGPSRSTSISTPLPALRFARQPPWWRAGTSSSPEPEERSLPHGPKPSTPSAPGEDDKLHLQPLFPASWISVLQGTFPSRTVQPALPRAPRIPLPFSLDDGAAQSRAARCHRQTGNQYGVLGLSQPSSPRPAEVTPCSQVF